MARRVMTAEPMIAERRASVVAAARQAGLLTGATAPIGARVSGALLC